MGTRLMKGLNLKRLLAQWSSSDLYRKSRAFSSTVSFSNLDEKDDMGGEGGGDFKGPRKNKEYEFRGVYRGIICGKVGQVPVQKILSNGHTITVFTVGTGGMFDQRIVANNLPMPAQWHRIAVHNEQLGAYAVQKLVKNAAVYVEGDIETRVYNDRVNDQVKNIPEICLRRDGKLRLLHSGESDVSKSLDELSKSSLHLKSFMFHMDMCRTYELLSVLMYD
ncbi:Single-stranded DNA-binding protein, mitochondrial [Dichanthelium oligosanthes]|uniref:Single-stranded DNA-binding protein, mitochondrial n=1 Tax=Dichanthelium oligosanthes TaxID=888268 RepID=A0A1E5VET6_9POAL|nr:Single-stranded DNA-binding protein, mitochondrial [Dichanthelium oligosanthes]